jgi:hypothetical protein
MKKALEILDNKTEYSLHFPDGLVKQDTVKEIHEHYIKFVEWFGENCWVNSIENKYGLAGNNPMNMTLEEVYQYYCDNILNKKK